METTATGLTDCLFQSDLYGAEHGDGFDAGFYQSPNCDGSFTLNRP